MRGEAEQARDLLLRCCGIAPDNAELEHAGLALRATGRSASRCQPSSTAQRLEPDAWTTS